MLKYFGLRLAVLLIAPLPSRLGHLIINFFGDLGFLFGRKSRAAVQGNLRRALGEQADPRRLRRATREIFRNLARNFYDLVRLPLLSPRSLNGRVELVGLERLEEARREGRGVVLATAHLGSWDLVAQATLVRGVPITILVEQLQPRQMGELVMRLRRTQGVSFQPAGSQGLKAAFRALRRGEVVALACDRAVLGRTIRTTFLGEPALMPTGAAQLALRTGAVLLPAFSTRIGLDRHRFSIEPPIRISLNGHGPPQVRETVDQLIAVMENHIRQDPAQWVVFDPIWTAK